MENITEEKLRELINSNKSKSVMIDNKKFWIGKKVKENIKKEEEKNGGILPLAALIPLIAGVVSAGAATAGGVATAVNQAKQAQ
jgi:Na+/alanine symporter